MRAVKMPDPSRTAAFILAIAEARAAALDGGCVLLVGDGGSAYLLHGDDGWQVQTATLFDPPEWTGTVRRTIVKHGD